MKPIDKLSWFDGTGSIAAIWLDDQLINAIDHAWEIQDCSLGVKIESVVFLRKRRLIDRVGTVRLQPLSGCQLFRNSVQHNLNRFLQALFSSFSQHLIKQFIQCHSFGAPWSLTIRNHRWHQNSKKFLSLHKVKTLFQPPPPALGSSSGEQVEEGQSLSSCSGRWTWWWRWG